LGRDLYYALGGGLGHLTRARAVLGTLGASASVLVSSPLARDPDVRAGLDLIHLPDNLPPAAGVLAAWLEALLRELRPRRLYLDSFPGGILGELCQVELPPGIEVHYLARLLRWNKYAQRVQGPLPRLHGVHLLEPLHPDHTDWLCQLGFEPTPLALTQPDLPPPRDALARFAAVSRPRWLIVHSGPAKEIDELLRFARSMARADGVTPSLVAVVPLSLDWHNPDVLRLHAHPARGLYPLADRIVTACGFNAMAETEPFRSIHRFIPMPRPLDDQFERAARMPARIS
jgi:hypothetical protein